jgi:hypothetical protein
LLKLLLAVFVPFLMLFYDLVMSSFLAENEFPQVAQIDIVGTLSEEFTPEFSFGDVTGSETIERLKIVSKTCFPDANYWTPDLIGLTIWKTHVDKIWIPIYGRSVSTTIITRYDFGTLSEQINPEKFLENVKSKFSQGRLKAVVERMKVTDCEGYAVVTFEGRVTIW